MRPALVLLLLLSGCDFSLTDVEIVIGPEAPGPQGPHLPLPRLPGESVKDWMNRVRPVMEAWIEAARVQPEPLPFVPPQDP